MTNDYLIRLQLLHLNNTFAVHVVLGGIKEVGAYCGYFIDTKGSGIKVYYK